MKNHITNVDGETRSHVRRANFGLTGAERGAFLTIGFPGDGSARTEDDGAAHAAEFEERELDTLTDGIADLRTPARIAVGGESMMLVRARRKGISVCLCIRRMWKGHVGVKGGFLGGREGEAVIDGGMDVLKNIQGRVEVAARWLVDVRR